LDKVKKKNPTLPLFDPGKKKKVGLKSLGKKIPATIADRRRSEIGAINLVFD